MRIDRLDLERYGHFEDRSLTFPRDKRVVVVHGANEAGKSTSLAAAVDLLFGFHPRSQWGYRHGNRAMSIAALLSAPDGSTLAVRRLKRQARTLVDPANDQPLPDDCLAHLLRGRDRQDGEVRFGPNDGYSTNLRERTLKVGDLATFWGDTDRGEFDGLEWTYRVVSVCAADEVVFSCSRSIRFVFPDRVVLLPTPRHRDPRGLRSHCLTPPSIPRIAATPSASAVWHAGPAPLRMRSRGRRAAPPLRRRPNVGHGRTHQVGSRERAAQHLN